MRRPNRTSSPRPKPGLRSDPISEGAHRSCRIPRKERARVTTVVHAITRLEFGGAQENTLYTCRGLAEDPHYRVFLLMGPGGLLDEEAHRVSGLQVVEVPELVRPLAPRADVRALPKLRRHLSDLLFEHRRLGHAPDAFIIHTHCSKAGVLGRLAARAAAVPRIIHTIHGFAFYPGQTPWKHGLYVNAERLAGRITDAFIGVSEANLEEARSRGIIRPHQDAHLIRSGMSLAPFRNAPLKPDARAALELSPDSEILVSVANLKAQKDPLCLIEAFARLARRRPRAILLYAGDGELRPEVEQAVARNGLEHRVRLLGWRRDVPRLMAAADVVVLASRFEGLPRTAVQAVASRRPFVGTRVDGTPEIIREGANGYLVEPQQPELLARAFERALDLRPIDPADVARVEAWDADHMVRAQKALYRSLTERGPLEAFNETTDESPKASAP